VAFSSGHGNSPFNAQQTIDLNQVIERSPVGRRVSLPMNTVGRISIT
jgi:hypothetical protein